MSENVIKAINFATKAHEGQVRKGSKTPYISHPFSVGFILRDNQCNEETIIAGILHDVDEDTDYNIEDIKLHFSERVGELVSNVSEDKSLSWEERKKHTIKDLEKCDYDTACIVCADKLVNILDIKKDLIEKGEDVWNIFKRGKKDQEWYYTEIAETLMNRDDVFESSSKMFTIFYSTVHRVFKNKDKIIDK